MVTCLAPTRPRPESSSPDWAEIHALLNAIRAPGRDDVLAVLWGICGDGLSQPAADRVADAIVALFERGPARV